ncbi:MAG: lysozyme inhibitor LprI family protein [Reyranellaceae bacterium]
MKRFVAALLVLTAVGGAAFPAATQSQRELNAAAAADFDKADRRLNDVYKALMAKISSNGQGRLREAQVTWLRFREQECIFETMGTEGGSIHGMMVTMCRTRLTAQRVKDLEHQLDCREGDVSCGGQ